MEWHLDTTSSSQSVVSELTVPSIFIKPSTSKLIDSEMGKNRCKSTPLVISVKSRIHKRGSNKAAQEEKRLSEINNLKSKLSHGSDVIAELEHALEAQTRIIERMRQELSSDYLRGEKINCRNTEGDDDSDCTATTASNTESDDQCVEKRSRDQSPKKDSTNYMDKMNSINRVSYRHNGHRNQPKSRLHREKNIYGDIEFENENSFPSSESMRVKRSQTRNMRRHSMGGNCSDHDNQNHQPKFTPHSEINFHENIEFKNKDTVLSSESMRVQRSRTRNARRHSMGGNHSDHDNQNHQPKSTPHSEINFYENIELKNKDTVLSSESMGVQRSRTRNARRHSMGNTYSDHDNKPKSTLHRERNIYETIEFENKYSVRTSASLRGQRSQTRNAQRHSMGGTYSDHDNQPKSIPHFERNFYETIEFENKNSVPSPDTMHLQRPQARSMRRHSMNNTSSNDRHYIPDHHPSQNQYSQQNGSIRRKGIHNRYLSCSGSYERTQQRASSEKNERATRIKCSSMKQFSGFRDDFYVQHEAVKYGRARRRSSLS